MSKIDENIIERLAPDIWEAPDGNFYVGGDYAGSEYPTTYLINVGKLLSYFDEDADMLRLIVKMQQLIISFVRENGRGENVAGYVSEEVAKRIDDVAHFAEQLEDCIEYRGNFVKAYNEHRIRKG